MWTAAMPAHPRCTDLFTPYAWTLASEVRPTASDTEDGCYSFMSTTTCAVAVTDSTLQSKIWFTTPADGEWAADEGAAEAVEAAFDW